MGGHPRLQTRPVRAAHLKAAVLAPGYGGTAQQPILRAMAERLQAIGIVPAPITFSRGRPAGDFAPELEDLRAARDACHAERLALVGRSFGGRMCARLAVVEPPDALVLLGHPIAPQNRPRPDDEAALAAVRCPTLIVQGEQDALGPLSVLRRIAADNPRIEIYVLKGQGHQFGPRTSEALEQAAGWLARTL